MDPSHSEVYQKIKHLRDSNRGIYSKSLESVFVEISFNFKEL